MKYTYRFKVYDPSREEYYGTILALANGRIGVRGELELLPSRYGFFLAGVYDYTPIFYRELVNFPRVNSLYITIGSYPLDPTLCDELDMTRTLDAYRGLVKTRIECVLGGNKVFYESTRIVHQRYKNLVLQYSRITLEEKNRVLIEAPIELDKANPLIPENIEVKHYNVVGVEELGDNVLLDLETTDKQYRVIVAAKTIVDGEPVKLVQKNNKKISWYYSGERDSIEILRIASIASNRETNNPIDKAIRVLEEASAKGYGVLLGEHSDEWRKWWDSISFTIEGDREAEKKLLFYAFHLLQLVDEEQEYLMIPARGLHGIGYRGHVFWDTDLYTLPFYALIAPQAARRILLYRYAMLDKARENARLNGYRGAQYPWESCDDGVEATPREIPLDLLGRKKIRIWTGEQEQHITADIALATHLYYEFTRDEEFMEKYGLEIIFETARFWASRVEYDDSRGGYVIRNVMGPDEYHPSVDNSFYTNVLAKKNLELGVHYYKEALVRKEWARVLKKLEVGASEVEEWSYIAENMYLPCHPNGLCEEFDGYLDLEDRVVENKGYTVTRISSLAEAEKTRLVKQADVIAALFFLARDFDEDALRVNYEYYLPRTTHESSLSLPTYAGVAALIGRTSDAWRLLSEALKTDLEDLYGNTRDGFHVAAAGGIWAALLLGFLRLKISRGRVEGLQPVIPEWWKRFKINIVVGGKKHSIDVLV